MPSHAARPSTVELFDRSIATLARSWAHLADGSPGAEVIETDGALIAAFVHSPDREFLNNTLLTRGVSELGRCLDRVEGVYADRGIERYAVWVHESEDAVADEVRNRGYRYDTSTRAMALPIEQLADVDTSKLDVIEPSLEEFWAVDGLDDLLPELDPEQAHFYVARRDGKAASTLMAFEHAGDCSIGMVETVPAARRQGLATELCAHAVAEAGERGCTTASLQATEMAEGVYTRVGFHDLGRFEEYVRGSPER
jgi:GNAT superfamily N-acetyltransferase